MAMKVIDRIIPISGPDAIRCSADLAAQAGIFVGITSGGTFAGALKVAADAEKGARPEPSTWARCWSASRASATSCGLVN
jgi:cysteine synthase